MKRKPRIALAQIMYFDIHDKNNLQKILEYIRAAKRESADIICFPETCVLREKYLHHGHPLLRIIKEECKKNNIWCIITDDFMHKKKLHNTSILINRKGEIKGLYRKIQPYAERGVTPGTRVKVFNTDFGRIGIAICWDLAFSHIFAGMKKLGAQIIFCPAQWAYEEKAHDKDHKRRELKLLRSLILARAFENLSFVAFCSPYRHEEDLLCYSAITSPHRILKEIVDKEGLICSDINLSELGVFKKIYPGK